MVWSSSTVRRSRGAAKLVALAATATVLLAACSSNDSGSSEGGDSVGPSASTGSADVQAQLAPYLVEPAQLPDLPPITEPVPKDKEIYFLSGGSGSQELIEAAIQPLVGDLGWKYHSVSYDGANPASANSALQTAVSNGADGIIFTGTPANSIEPAVAAAKKKNVPVVVLNGTDPISTPDIYQVGQIQASAPEWANASALAVLNDAQKRGETANMVVVSTGGSETFPIIADANTDALKSLCSECTAEVLDVPINDFAAGKSPASVVSYIQSHPETNYVVVIGFPGAMRSALDSAGLEDVQVGGLVSTPSNLEGVKSGDFFYWIATPNGYLGAQGVDALVRAFTGGDAGIHGDQAEPTWIVTADSELPSDGVPEFPVGYPEAFKKLWNVN